MTGSEASLAIPAVIYLPLAGLIALTLAWHALVAPRLIARRHWKRLARLRVELGIAEREEAR